MKTIVTIQHTQSIHHTNGMVGSWTDWDLSEIGKKQAKCIGDKLSKKLAGRNFVMYSSDLKRAKQTAEFVGQYMELSPILTTELRERNLGKCVGKSVQWLRENIECQEKLLMIECFLMLKVVEMNGIDCFHFIKRYLTVKMKI